MKKIMLLLCFISFKIFAINSGLYNHIRNQEQLILIAKKDFNGQIIAGYSHHDTSLREGDTISLEQAKKWLKKYLNNITAMVDKLNINLSDNQKIVFCSLLYNIKGFRQTETFKMIITNPKDTLIPDKIRLFCFSTNKSGRKFKLKGLVIRRNLEADMWND
jgi:hypothetical protein